VQALIAGTLKHTPNGSLTFGNATHASDALVQLLRELAAALEAHNAAQIGAKDAMSALRDTAARVGPVVRAYRRYLVATYGNAAQALADYGLVPPKARAPLTSEAQATAVSRLRATRKARGTTSKKQKAAIKGTADTTTGHAPAATAPTPPKPVL
ncbi:MAG: hypothetical protein M3O50_13335, partial [Myxococcota bacterium]|nr:hypothetical protein [Myxococcota bacterium]